MQKVIEVEPTELLPPENVTLLHIEINVSNLLGILKKFDALFSIELIVGDVEEYRYSFIQRNVVEGIVEIPAIVKGKIKDISSITYNTYISFISKSENEIVY